jgi:diguanylate cyclase (GGDEF)-like protein
LFPLLRYFSIASLISVVITTVLLAVLHHRIEREQLLTIGESNHVALAQSFANSLLPAFRQLAETAARTDNASLPAHPDFAAMHRGVLDTMRNTSVIKVKLYDLNGRTIFSTEAAQVGKDYSTNAGFVAARAGDPASELTHRARFSAFDREIVDRDVLSSYVALQAGGGAPVEGVLEVYSDVTEWVAHTDEQAKVITIAVVVSLCLLYAVLHVIVQRADVIIRAQYEQQKKSEDEIRFLAFYDPLTRLPNRRLLQDRLEQALAGSHRTRQWGALLFVDLDHFKAVNDRHGHDKGDQLLVQVAQRLKSSVREVDTVSRWGGDEFIVILEAIGETRELAREHAQQVAGKILAAFAQPFQLAGDECRNSPSVGVTLFQGQDLPVKQLLREADAAMYGAKSAGRNTVRVFGERP